MRPSKKQQMTERQRYPIILKGMLAELGISQEQWADRIKQLGKRAQGKPLSLTAAADILNRNTWPSETPQKYIMAQTETLLRGLGVPDAVLRSICPDSWDAHYNLGNYYLGQNRPKEALAEYEIAYKHEPQSVLTLVNAAMAHAKLGEPAKAEEKLNEALKISPDSVAARYNLGLLKAEQGDLPMAEKNLRAAFGSDPQLAGAAYNLCIITATDRPAEALEWCRKATTLRPGETKYAWTLALYQRQAGDSAAAVATLDELIGRDPVYPDAHLLLADIYEQQGKKEEAGRVYRRALATHGMPERAREYFKFRLDGVKVLREKGE